MKSFVKYLRHHSVCFEVDINCRLVFIDVVEFDVEVNVKISRHARLYYSGVAILITAVLKPLRTSFASANGDCYLN